MKLWEEGDIIDKAEQSRTKKERFPSNIKPINIENISPKFK